MSAHGREWRAVAERWSEGSRDNRWYGRWQPRNRALAQARRWAGKEGVGSVWVEQRPTPDANGIGGER